MAAKSLTNYPEVDHVIRELKLPVHQLLEDGPRYVVASTEYQGRPALFKMMVPHAFNPTPPEDAGVWQLSLYDNVRKEIALLEFLTEHRGRIAGQVPELLNHGKTPGSAWYIRELLHGAPMAAAGTPFVFPARFYREVPAARMVAYFRSLHELSPLIRPQLERHLKLWLPRVEHIRLLAVALGGEWSHPEVRRLAARLEPWILEGEPLLRRAGRVIAHDEPFATHIFLEHGKIGLIDWEAASYGHPLHDFSRLWVRFFDNEAYRSEFEQELAGAGYLDGEGALAWDVTRMVQSVASLNHYYNNHILAPDIEQRLYSTLSGAIAEIAKRRL